MDEYKEYKAEQELEEQERTEFLENSTEYVISGLPGTIRVDNYYHVYSLDNEFTETMCKQQGIKYDNMITYLEAVKEYTNTHMVIVPKYQKWDDGEIEITVKIKDGKDYGINNLYDESSNIRFDFARALSTNFGAEDYDILSNYGNRTYFIGFDCVLTQPERRYATIINGKMVYVVVMSKSGELSKEQIDDVDRMIDYITFERE